MATPEPRRIEASYPFSNSNHPGGTNMMFCDGAVRFITNTIDGTVYSEVDHPGRKQAHRNLVLTLTGPDPDRDRG